ncbi:MAG: serine/threonine-protein kinase, partial [Planctomycetota bacterium]|nr:serine/threonine-protein kinase [Planctomycetota bacterium]
MAEGRKIGNFQLLERLGQGGMGAVFKARQLSMDRIVALKVLPPSLAKQPTFIERFMREARASARLSHPNIVGGIDVGQDGGVYYFAMEYVDGSSAKDLVEKGKLGETQVLKIGKAVAQALAHAHEHGILHRDIKPDNILIDKNGTPKLCDLGLARLDSQTEGEKALTQEGMTLGTPHYISPEQARGQRDLDTKTDLYSLGATLYHLLTGKTMFEGTTNVVVMTKHVTDKCPSPADAGTQASKGMVTVLAKLLAKDRADRYESAEKLVEDFDRVARGKPPLHAELPPAKWPFSGGVPGAPARKPGSTGPVSPVDKGRATRRDAQPEAAAKRVPWLVPAGVLAAIVIVVIVCLGRGGPSAPPPEASPAKAPPPVVAHQDPAPPKAVPSSEDAKRLLEAAEDFATKNPTNVAGALAEFEKVQAAARGTEFAAKAKDAIAALTRRRDEAADAAAKKFVSDADALAAQAKYDSAIAVWEGIPADQVGLLRARAARAIGDRRAPAEAKRKAVMDVV